VARPALALWRRFRPPYSRYLIEEQVLSAFISVICAAPPRPRDVLDLAVATMRPSQGGRRWSAQSGLMQLQRLV
jgi:hypothetical protein